MFDTKSFIANYYVKDKMKIFCMLDMMVYEFDSYNFKAASHFSALESNSKSLHHNKLKELTTVSTMGICN